MPPSRPAPAMPMVVPPWVVILGAGLFAWWSVWHGKFLFDDLPAIVDDIPLQDGDWLQAAFGPQHHPLANRPLACLSLVIDFAVFGPGPFGPHLTNLLLHLANALLLAATTQRALQAPNLAGRFTPAAARAIATAVATLWVVHPLGGDAVAYATQRSTVLASGCLLLALFATLRANEPRHRRRWLIVVWTAAALGMASKEDFVSAPLLLLLFERSFLCASWSAMRVRVPWYGVLALTWILLAAFVVSGPVNTTVGWNTASGITAWQWLMTQASVVVGYARLAAWPQPLRGAYDQGVTTELAAALLPGLLVVAALGATVSLWRRRPWWGWLGALFFLWLAPTSTILPIETEIVAERRAYLPMLAVIVPVVIGARALLARANAPWLASLAALGATTVLAFVARERVAVHADGPAFWGDAYAKRDPASRSLLAGNLMVSQAMMLSRQGRFAEADVLLDRAMECEHLTARSLMQHAVSIQRRGRHAEAIDALRKIVRGRPQEGEVLGTLGTCLLDAWGAERGAVDDPRIAEAEDALRRALVILPRKAAFWNSLANVLSVRGRLAEAEDALAHVTALTTEHPEPFFRRADLLDRLGRSNEIAPMFAKLLAARPDDAALRALVAKRAAGGGAGGRR